MSEFVDYLHEVFAQFGPIHTRRMFGGHGVYRDGLMFGLVADDMLYLKTDAQSRPEFETLGLGPFEYLRDGKALPMSYHAAPESIYDDPDEATLWARRAHAAALRASAGKPARAPRSRSTDPARRPAARRRTAPTAKS